MVKRKETKKFTFTVEGNTEYLYFEWLQRQINNSDSAKYKALITKKVEQNPLKFAKLMVTLPKTSRKRALVITHICDVEGTGTDDVKKFHGILDKLDSANRLGRNLNYRLGYSNLTFELWILLHKTDFERPLTDRRDYLQPISSAFNVKFEDLKQYKEQENFKRCLSSLTLNDVKDAIDRARHIMNKKNDVGGQAITYKGFKYFQENPSLTVCDAVDKILEECGV